jgi:hypothetical protein
MKKIKLRGFDSLGGESGTAGAKAKAPTVDEEADLPYEHGSSKWGPFHFFSSRLSVHAENLVLHCAAAPDDAVAARLRDVLVPGWRALSWAVPFLAQQYKVRTRLIGNIYSIFPLRRHAAWNA